MFQAVYEIGLAGHVIEIDYETWNVIRDRARSYKHFIVVYNNEKYKYCHAQTYMERPTKFDFELAKPEDEEIEYIYIN